MSEKTWSKETIVKTLKDAEPGLSDVIDWSSAQRKTDERFDAAAMIQHDAKVMKQDDFDKLANDVAKEVSGVTVLKDNAGHVTAIEFNTLLTGKLTMFNKKPDPNESINQTVIEAHGANLKDPH